MGLPLYRGPAPRDPLRADLDAGAGDLPGARPDIFHDLTPGPLPLPPVYQVDEELRLLAADTAEGEHPLHAADEGEVVFHFRKVIEHGLDPLRRPVGLVEGTPGRPRAGPAARAPARGTAANGQRAWG